MMKKDEKGNWVNYRRDIPWGRRVRRRVMIHTVAMGVVILATVMVAEVKPLTWVLWGAFWMFMTALVMKTERK
jgi:hypothetical protein